MLSFSRFMRRNEDSNLSNWVSRNDNKHLGSSNNEISDKIRPTNLREKHREHFRNWRSSSEFTNKYLKGELPNSLTQSDNPTHQRRLQHIAHIDNAIDSNKLKHNLHTYSGTSFNPEEHIDQKTKIMHSPTYISSSHDKKEALSFSKPDKNNVRHIIHFHLNPGNSAIHISRDGGFEEQHETIIGRDSKFQHMGKEEYNDEQGKVIVHKMKMVN